MTLKRILTAICLIICCGSMTDAQAQVSRYHANESNGFGVVYMLPQSRLRIEALVERTDYTPGKLSAYALKYLNQNVGLEATVSYRLLKVRVLSEGIPDREHQYVVEFKPGTVAPYLSLTANGIIAGINTDATTATATAWADPTQAETHSTRAMPTLPQEYNLAGSLHKKAELAAQHLFYVRESSMNIVTGDVDAMPKDGQAMQIVMDRLTQEEAATRALFVGDTVRHQYVQSFRITPSEPFADKVIFRFSEQLGVLEADDLAGEPVRMTLQVVERAPQMDEKEAAKHEKNLKGIVYNRPGMGEVQVSRAQEILYRNQLHITQWGIRQSLAPKMFKDKQDQTPSILFDPDTGGILKIQGPDGKTL